MARRNILRSNQWNHLRMTNERLAVASTQLGQQAATNGKHLTPFDFCRRDLADVTNRPIPTALPRHERLLARMDAANGTYHHVPTNRVNW